MRGSRALIAAIVTLAAVLPAASAFVSGTPRDDARGAAVRAQALMNAKDWDGAVTLLQDTLRREAGDASTHEMLGNALLQLGRGDEAAHYLEIALRRYQIEGKDDKARNALSSLRRADPLSLRRDSFFKKLVDTLADSAEDLSNQGHAERALRILERLPAAAVPGKEASRVAALLEKVRAVFKEVHLDEQSAAKPASGEWPLFESESEHYKFACNLEPDVVKRLGAVMDDIHAFYVQVYFDGDARKAQSAKPTIRVHPTKAKMLGNWQGGGSTPEGWWSPGSNEVITFDTRTQSGTLDDMLVTLFHESSHQFMTLVSRGGFTPAWLNEGTASFFEGTVAMADGRVLWPGPALGRLRNLTADLRANKTGGLTAHDVVSYAEPGSYGAEYYAWGWGLVYFLQEYEDPKTLEYVYRPLYSEYRAKIIQRGGDPMKVFEEVFLGKASPLGHATFAAFEADWRRWILEEVAPLYESSSKARALHLDKVRIYLAAADAAHGKSKAAVDENELLARALGHIEYVRAHIDKDDKADGELIVQQADLLERLKRPAGAAPLLEKALDLADEGRFKLDEKRYADLEKRLAKLDRKNAALRTARSRTSELTRTALGLLDDYRASKEPLILRSYTFAALAGAVLQDDKRLLPAANELREAARKAQLLLGSLRPLQPNPDLKKTLFSTPPTRFETMTTPQGSTKSVLDCVLAAGFLDTNQVLTGEYVVRAHITRNTAMEPGAVLGLVIAGQTDGDWTMIGVDDRGFAGAWELVLSKRGGSSLGRSITMFPKPPVDLDKPIDLAVHVFRDGKFEVQVNGSEPMQGRLALDANVARYVGVFAKYANVTFEDAVVEIYP
jgi:hypothetical protein